MDFQKCKVMKFISQWQFVAENFPGEVNKEPSMTEPNQTYSLREILRRSAVGMDVTSTMSRHVEYDENPDVDDYVVPHGADITEVVNEFDKSVSDYNEEIENQKKQKEVQ